jgi:synaptojanin
MSLAGMVSDVRKSAARLYINNFVDPGRQNTMDLLLGRLNGQRAVELYDPISDYVNSQLAARADEFSRTEELQIWVGSYNLNGCPPTESLASWLFPDGSTLDPDIIAVGFQEIVELTAQQIMSTDPAKRYSSMCH